VADDVRVADDNAAIHAALADQGTSYFPAAMYQTTLAIEF